MTRSAPNPQAEPAPSATPRRAGQAAAAGDRPVPPEGEIRAFIHHVAGSDEDAAEAQRLADYLERRGFTVAEIRPVDFRIGKPSVRYFFEHDRSASERLVDELGRFDGAAAAAPDHASDFTHFEPKPHRGNVEVWLPGP